MDLYMYIIMGFIVLCIILMWFVNTYNHFQSYIIRINEAETNTDSALRKRFDLLNKSINIIKTNAKLDKKAEVLTIIGELRSQKLSNFELDRKLYDAINEFVGYKEKYDDLKKCENFIKIEVALNETEIELTSCRRYYNDVITNYNKLVKRFPSLIVAFICNYHKKLYFDGKNMEDKNVNDFKL